MPDKLAAYQLLDESMQKALQKVLKEMPDVKPVKVSSQHDSILPAFLRPKGALATTSPFGGNISYNPELMLGMSQSEIENTLAHELTHSRQYQNMSFMDHLKEMGNAAISQFGFDEKPPAELPANSPINTGYYWRPHEMEAFQAERDRTTRLGLQDVYTDPMLGTRDIMLPGPRINTGPSPKTTKKLVGK